MRIGGLIGYLRLESLWKSLSNAEKEFICGGDYETYTKREVNGFYWSALNFINNKIGWAEYEKLYSLADKLIAEGERISKDSSLCDQHMFLCAAMKCYYMQRNKRPEAVQLASKFALRDIRLFPEYKPELLKTFGEMPHISSFHQLAIIYEKAGMYEDAIKVSELAMQYGLNDLTTGGYPARIKRLQNKIKKRYL